MKCYPILVKSDFTFLSHVTANHEERLINDHLMCLVHVALILTHLR